MKCPKDITIWNKKKRPETKFYQFLNVVNNEFDQKKKDVLRKNLLPEVESAYATIRSKRDQRLIMGATRRDRKPTETSGIDIGLSARAKISIKNILARKNPVTPPKTPHDRN